MTPLQLRSLLETLGEDVRGTQSELEARLKANIESRKRIRSDDGPAEAQQQLECPVCMETILPPILQCAAGHLICSDCLAKLARPKLCPERGPASFDSGNFQQKAGAASALR